MRSGLVVLVMLVLTSGCTSSQTGNEGNFVFTYFTDDDFTNFNKPIAVNAFLDLFVDQVGTRDPVALTSAESDDPSVLDVVGFQGNRYIVEATGVGTGRVSVEGNVNGETLTDSIDMRTATPDRIRLFHTCTSAGTAYYLTSQAIYLGYELERSSGEAVIGYGYYPVTETPGALTIDFFSDSQQYIPMVTTSSTGSFDVDSTLAGDTERLVVDVVDPFEINGVTLQLGANQSTFVNETDFYYVLPTVDGVPVCQANTPYDVQTTTPNICSVRENDPNNRQNEFGWFEVTGNGTGTCTVEVSYPESADGTVAVGTVNITIR